MQTKHLCVLFHIRTKGDGTVKLVYALQLNSFADRSKAVLLLWIIFCYLCFVLVMLSCLFIAASWAPAWKWLTSWFACM